MNIQNVTYDFNNIMQIIAKLQTEIEHLNLIIKNHEKIIDELKNNNNEMKFFIENFNYNINNTNNSLLRENSIYKNVKQNMNSYPSCIQIYSSSEDLNTFDKSSHDNNYDSSSSQGIDLPTCDDSYD